MKLSYIIENIDRSEANTVHCDFRELSREFFDYEKDMDYDKIEEYEDRLKGYWIAPHNCTDTWVGMIVYFLDESPLFISAQEGRKSDIQFHFFSIGGFNAVGEFVTNMLPQPIHNPSIINPYTAEMGVGYDCHYGDEFLTDKVMYLDRPATIVEKFRSFSFNNADNKTPDRIVIKTEDGEELNVPAENVIVPYRTIGWNK